MLDPSPVQRVVADDLQPLLVILPEPLRTAIGALPDQNRLVEVVLDLGRKPEARLAGGEVRTLAETPIAREDLREFVSRVGHFGVDNRAGIEGTLHRISALRNRAGDIVGLTCRVGRAVHGTVDILRDRIDAGSSLLLLGRPGVGKTTLLREAARVLADDLGKRVIVVDTSNEIAGDGDVPHPGIGHSRRMQVPSPAAQHAVMIEAVENHMPEVIVIDEIGTAAEALAARTIAERGVQLIATAHGNSLENLMQNPTLADLVGGIHAVTLSDDEARRCGTQKTVLERKAPPTFSELVEIHSKDRLAVYERIDEVVDARLRGHHVAPEIRQRTATGGYDIEAASASPQNEKDDGQGRADQAGHQRLALPGLNQAPGQRLRRIFPFAVSRRRLEREIQALGVPARLVHRIDEADLLVTLKAQERRQPQRLLEAEMRGVPLAVIKSNTPKQIERFLRHEFNLGDELGPESATPEVQRAIDQAVDSSSPVALAPQNRWVRRLQHEMIADAGLHASSEGDEPFRQVIIQPG